MFRALWSRTLLNVACSRKDRRRSSQRRKPVRLMVESLEERLTPSGGQTAGSYTALVNAVAADTAANTNYVIDITNNFTFTSGGQVSISNLGSGSTLTIEGQNGSNFTLTGNNNRLFDIASGQNVTFKDLTLTQGTVSNFSVAQGGAILDTGGNLVLSKVAVTGNLAEGVQAQGGGIYVNGGSLTLEGGCTIQSNTVFSIMSSKMTVEAQGGGVFVTGPSTVQITDSAISDNNVSEPTGSYTGSKGAHVGASGGVAAGGGLYVGGNGWNVTLTGDSLSGNQATGGNGWNGTAVRTGPPGFANGGAGGTASGGGAAFVVGSGANTNTLTILNDPSYPSLILDNSVQGGGGGAGGALYTTSSSSIANGGAGGMGGLAQGGGVSITNQGGSLTANLGNTTFYGNKATGGNGGAGGAPVGGGTAGSAGAGLGGMGGGLAIPMRFGSGTVTMVNSTVAANNVLGGLNGDGSVRSSAGGSGIALAMSSNNPTFTLDNNTITHNTIGGGQTTGAAGVEFQIIVPIGNPPPASGNLLLYNNVIQSNGNGSSTDDLGSFGFGRSGAGNIALTNATNNFIGTISANAVTTTSNIVGNTQPELGNAVGVDSQGNPTGGPIYYPLASGVSSIGYGTTSVLSTIASVEGTATATDALGNAMPSAGPINLGAVQVVLPAITLQPSNQTAMVGANVSFTATAGGTPAPTVQWQISTDGGQNWTDITGATGTTLTLSNVSTSMSGHEYRAVFSNSGGDASTNAVTLKVHAPAPPPAPPTLHVPPLLAFFNSLLGGVETVNANGTETITDRLFGIPLIVSTFDSQGNLESVLFLGINLTLVFELL